MKITKNRRAICKDGFSLSVQADSMTYCSPRVNDAYEYTAVEVGFPSWAEPVPYTHLRSHEAVLELDCRLLLEKNNEHYQKTVVTKFGQLTKTTSQVPNN